MGRELAGISQLAWDTDPRGQASSKSHALQLAHYFTSQFSSPSTLSAKWRQHFLLVKWLNLSKVAQLFQPQGLFSNFSKMKQPCAKQTNKITWHGVSPRFVEPTFHGVVLSFNYLIDFHLQVYQSMGTEARVANHLEANPPHPPKKAWIVLWLFFVRTCYIILNIWVSRQKCWSQANFSQLFLSNHFSF